MTTRTGASWGLFFAVSLALSACSGGAKETPPPPDENGNKTGDTNATSAKTAGGDTASDKLPAGQWYHAFLDFEDLGELPFYFLVPEDDSKDAYLKNGDELLAVSHKWDGDKLQIDAPWNYVTRITATRGKDGTLTGEFVRDFPLWGRCPLKLRAEPVSEPDPEKRFPGGVDKSAPDLSGVWRLQFEEHGLSKGELKQEGDVIRGYMRPGWLGDLRFLAGNVRDGQLLMSTFNGNSVNLIKAKLSDGGTKMSGIMSMYNIWNEKFTAEKVDGDFVRNTGAHLKKGKHRISEPVLKKYKGKPVVVFYFATWCPSCNDATPFFVKLYDKYKDKGVKFVSLAYDLSEDEAANKKQLAEFRKKYGITWETKEVPVTPQEWQKKMVPEIVGWDGFPVTVFIRRDGTVEAVYGGWYGPAAPKQNAKIKAQFDRWVAAIVKS